jgi:predicted DNA-binding transcriptional regulator YafY
MIAPDLLARFDVAVRYDMPAGLSADETRAVRDALRRVDALEAALREATADLDAVADAVQPPNTKWWMLDDPPVSNLPETEKAALHLAIRARQQAERHRQTLAAAPCPTCHETDCQPIEETRT